MKEISGDIKLNRKDQFMYLFWNFFRGIWGYRVYLKTKFWHPKTLDLNTDSPGRQYLNSFLKQEFPKILPNKNISILDIGCGTGYVRSILETMGYGGEYLGVDVFREPKFIESSPSFSVSFVQSKIEDFATEKRFDLVISNTSFEHIPDDFKAAEQANKFSGENGIQIHIMPAFWSLPIYLLHGYRQYNPDRMKKLFPNNTVIYRLGGVFTFLLYFFLITIPERLTAKMLFRKTSLYPKFLNFANSVDRMLPFMSTFYIVVIDSKNGNSK